MKINNVGLIGLALILKTNPHKYFENILLGAVHNISPIFPAGEFWFLEKFKNNVALAQHIQDKNAN